MCIPFADHRSNLRERFKWSLMMPFVVGGVAVFAMLYLQMFRLAWFESIFNGKDSGPMGMILFALTGFAAGAYSGWRLVSRCMPANIA